MRSKGDWGKYIDKFLEGYRFAKQRGDELGMSVILGAELRFPENDNHYLIYGIDENFLRNNQYLYLMGIKEFYREFGNEVLIIQAHPYRYNNNVVYHDYIHGVEVVNSCPNHLNYNNRALGLCKNYPALYRVCGSDVHNFEDAGLTYTLFDCPIVDSFEYKAAVETRRGALRCHLDKYMSILREAEKIPNQ
jgi:predicted metal-dependent phosphoesterase TrpH